MTRVVLVVGRPRPDAAEMQDTVATLAGAGADVVVISHDPVMLTDAPVHVVGRGPQPRPRPRPLAVRLARHAVRVVLRRTASARLARAALRHPDASAALRAADVLVAGDPPAIELVWRAARRIPEVPAVNGVPAALCAIPRTRGADGPDRQVTGRS